MQGPIADIVRLGLLVLFFGVQQRTRPHSYIRQWFLGWIFIFLGYMVWAVRMAQPVAPISDRVLDVLCFDLLLLGVLTFLVSTLPPVEWRRRDLAGAVALGVVNVAVINAQQTVSVSLPKLLLVVTILLWHGVGMYVGTIVLQGRLERMRKPMFALCTAYGAALIVYVMKTQARCLNSWAIGEVLLCTAILYWAWGEKKSLVRWVGTAGFVGWAAFYFANLMLPDGTRAHQLLDEFWSFPKYFVAVTMILKIFEDTANDQLMMVELFRELYEDFRLIYNSHPHPMWICDAEGGRFLPANEAMLREYGYSMEELYGMEMAGLEVPDAEEGEEEQGPDGEGLEGMRVKHLHKDGRVVWVNRTVREITYLGKAAQFVIARDVTERIKLDKELSHRARHDALTGLPNRQLMEERVAQCLAACVRDDRRATLLTIDVDHFKLINDTYGHLVGDECLKVVAARLKSRIRKVDTIARTGGEEFMAIVGGLTSGSDAEKVAGSLLRVFDTPLEVSIGELHVTVSVGVAVYPDDAGEVETLRRLSDEALYRAKRGGRNRAAYAGDLAGGGELRQMDLVG